MPKTISKIRNKSTRAHRVLSNKFCRCVKKLEPRFGSKSIGICTKSVFTRKNLKRGRFSCKPNKVDYHPIHTYKNKSYKS